MREKICGLKLCGFGSFAYLRAIKQTSMTTKEIYDYFETLTLRQQAEIIGHLTDARNDHFNRTYRVVSVFNGAANISALIRKITGFNCWHEPGSSPLTCGINAVAVPVELYTPELAKALDEYFGQHVSGITSEGWHTILENIINS
jgi:hypothetical protein